MDKYTPEKIRKLKKNEIFVFGSNLLGIHGAGAAKDAMSFGAVRGIGVGHEGQTYALPTKDHKIKTLPLGEIVAFVNDLYDYIVQNQEYIFLITKVGCGLSGYTVEQIAPMFKEFVNLSNVRLPREFVEHLNSQKTQA
jgi:hypothetical protein